MCAVSWAPDSFIVIGTCIYPQRTQVGSSAEEEPANRLTSEVELRFPETSGEGGQQPLARAHSRRPRSMFLWACVRLCVHLCVCVYTKAVTLVPSGPKAPFRSWKSSSVGRSEQEHTPCVLVCTLAHLVYNDLQQQFLGTGAFSDSIANPALRWTSTCTSHQPYYPDVVPGASWGFTSANSISKGLESWCPGAAGEPSSETLCSRAVPQSASGNDCPHSHLFGRANSTAHREPVQPVKAISSRSHHSFSLLCEPLT